MLGFSEILITVLVCFIVLVLFGKRLPDTCRSLGQGIMAFKKGLRDPDPKDGKKEELPS